MNTERRFILSDRGSAGDASPGMVLFGDLVERPGDLHVVVPPGEQVVPGPVVDGGVRQADGRTTEVTFNTRCALIGDPQSQDRQLSRADVDVIHPGTPDFSPWERYGPLFAAGALAMVSLAVRLAGSGT